MNASEALELSLKSNEVNVDYNNELQNILNIIKQHASMGHFRCIIPNVGYQHYLAIVQKLKSLGFVIHNEIGSYYQLECDW